MQNEELHTLLRAHGVRMTRVEALGTPAVYCEEVRLLIIDADLRPGPAALYAATLLTDLRLVAAH